VLGELAGNFPDKLVKAVHAFDVPGEHQNALAVNFAYSVLAAEGIIARVYLATLTMALQSLDSVFLIGNAFFLAA
jgi:hypothetical protein